MAQLASLSAGDVRTVVGRFGDLLDDYREVINRLNVYPVPDGDTGTNMSLTVASVVKELEGVPASSPMADVCRAVSHGSLMGARGNSGVILSQLLRGIAETLRDHEEVLPATLADALAHADRMARQAVVRPVEGTILTISRAAADGAHDAEDLTGLVRAARASARTALEHTPEQLPVLAQAGVVDAGGAGLCLLLDALCNVVAGDALPEAPPLERIPVHAPELVAVHDGGHDDSLRYEVMYFLETNDNALSAFKEVWAGIGDSIVVVGGDGLFNCHIHTDDVGAAIEAALDVGRPRGIRVTDLAEQVIEERWVREGAFEGAGDAVAGTAPATSIVAVVQGDGIGRIFRSLGVRQIVSGGQSMNPSTEELLAAVAATGSAEVVLLPNNKNIVPVANQVAAVSTIPVHVVATSSIVEGFAALLAYDPDASGAANGSAMTSSAEHVLAAEVTQAVRDTTTDAGVVREGDWIGLTNEGVKSIAESVAVAACALLEVVVDDTHELVTVIEGDGATPANTRRITQWLAEERPRVAVEVHHGGQPLYPYLFGIE
ncbi:MAG TPA: DAK2 domain-containing protein [Acidimicrobiales bacterium]|nr:DAK2 domain-containing protein [Acidimicrobiales bacterium]